MTRFPRSACYCRVPLDLDTVRPVTPARRSLPLWLWPIVGTVIGCLFMLAVCLTRR